MSNEEHILSTKKSKRFFFSASAADFKKIPGSPIAYWVSDILRNAFLSSRLGDISVAKQGLATGDNEQFLRFWYEVEASNLNFTNENIHVSEVSTLTWVPYSKGGAYRKWYGNNDYIVEWIDGGKKIRAFKDENGNERSRFRASSYYFKPAITWSLTSSGSFGCRHRPKGFVFDINGMSLFPFKVNDTSKILSLLNSKVANAILKILNPTMAFQIGDISSVPGLFPDIVKLSAVGTINQFPQVKLAQIDWDSFETSWDFTSLPLMHHGSRQPTIKATYQELRAHWYKMTTEMQRLEEENNRIFIDAYGLQDELTPEVPLNEITLTCNPHYRYSNSKNADELEVLLLADTMKEFVSYAVGCMFGRYSLDKPGLILANQGETIEDYWKNIRAYQNLPTANCPLPTDSVFPPDADNVIPILDGDWFTDDVSERFRKFLRITFGEEHYEENLKFIEGALGKDIRKYFLKDFYSDHVRRYKKRPIYWLFSSTKGSFNALIYMHRYRSDTVSVVLNYLREFRVKLTTQKNHLEAVSISASASAGEKTKALKEIESLRKMIEELDSYEREILYPLATEQLEIDLDDGVKVNYQKFGPALRKIPGLDTKEE